MTSTKTTDARLEVQARLDAIGIRIQTRTGEIADIEARQLEAATGGEDPDPTLATAKAALLDAQGIDEKAAAAVRAQLDQIDAAAARERDLARLAQLRREAAEKAREAEAEGDALAAALDAALEALRASGVDLHERIGRVRARISEAGNLSDAGNALAGRLGEPADIARPVDHLGRVYRGLGGNVYRCRVFNGSSRNPTDAVTELGAAAAATMPKEASASIRSGFSFSGGG